MRADLYAAGRGTGTLMHSHMAEFTAQVLKTEVSFLCAIIPVTYCYGKSVQCGSTSSNNVIIHVWLFVQRSNFVPLSILIFTKICQTERNMFMASVSAALCKQRYSLKPQDEFRDDSSCQRALTRPCVYAPQQGSQH
jgi:Ni/Fe-hydrogenase subunit HybB-like protein